MVSNQSGPMPWRLQIAVQLMAAGHGDAERGDDIWCATVLRRADSLIAAHIATVPKCEHANVFNVAKGPWTWDVCRDCGVELKP